MAKLVHDDLAERSDVKEQILVRSDVKDLIRFKSVCKSWYSLITSPRFISRHLNRSYNKDLYNNEMGCRRISLVDHHVIGSSNGLVCVSSLDGCKLLVGNPLSGKVTQLTPPDPTWICSPISCWGFGYDSSTDDYKVVIGASKGEKFQLQVLSLKSNVWRCIKEVNRWFLGDAGVLCNGALHWLTRGQNQKKLIISYDLCKEKFREIPQPDDTRYNAACSNLGIIKECLCLCERSRSSYVSIWLMKEYDVKESWELLPRDHEMKCDIVHYLRSPMDEGLYHIDESWFTAGTLEGRCGPTKYIDAPIFVQSLVSPDVNRDPVEKIQLIKGGPSAPGPNVQV